MRKELGFAVLVLMFFALGSQAQNASRVRLETSSVPLVPALLIIQAPEPSSPALLAIDLLSVGGLVLVVRRRAASKKTIPPKNVRHIN